MDNIADLMDELEKNGAIRQLENEQSEREKIQLLRQLIGQISKTNVGDDPIFLAEYINNVIKVWAHDFDTALTCFKHLSSQLVNIKE